MINRHNWVDCHKEGNSGYCHNWDSAEDRPDNCSDNCSGSCSDSCSDGSEDSEFLEVLLVYW